MGCTNVATEHTHWDRIGVLVSLGMAFAAGGLALLQSEANDIETSAQIALISASSLAAAQLEKRDAQIEFLWDRVREIREQVAALPPEDLVLRVKEIELRLREIEAQMAVIMLKNER